MKNIWLTGIVGGLLAPLAIAQGAGSGERGSGREADAAFDAPRIIERATDAVVGLDIENAEGLVGNVADVYLNPRGQVVYYVMQTAGHLMEARVYAVPASCATYDPVEERFLVDLSTERLLDELEPFDPDEAWPARASDAWCSAATAETLPSRPEESRTVGGATSLAIVPATAWNLESLITTEVTALDGSPLGRVADVGIDLTSGRIGFWILSTDAGADLIAVPWEALSFLHDPEPDADPDEFRFVLDVSSDELERAPEFDPDDEDDWRAARKPDWLVRRYDDYGLAFALYYRCAVAGPYANALDDGGDRRTDPKH